MRPRTGSGDRASTRRDRIVLPFSIICGECDQGKRGNFSVCERTSRYKDIGDTVFGHATAGLFGYSHLTGGYPGGQAEYVRVPYADVAPVRILNGPAGNSAPWLWGRVAGDALDLATLAAGLGARNPRKANVAIALAAVAGVAALDGVCAQALGGVARGDRKAVRDYSDRRGMPRPPRRDARRCAKFPGS